MPDDVVPEPSFAVFSPILAETVQGPTVAAMLGWLRLARICASRVNRASRSGSSAKASGRILSAT